MLKRAQAKDRYWVEGAILDFTEEMVNRMEQLGVSKTELAQQLKTRPSFITKILRGTNNFTLETMVKVARALKSQVRVHLEPEGTISAWMDFLDKEHDHHAMEDVSTWDPADFTKVVDFPAIKEPNEPLAAAK